MYRTFIKPLSLLAILAFVGIFASCQKDEGVTPSVDNFVQVATRGIESDCGAGIAGCYQLVFPVTIQFADSSTVQVSDYKGLKQAIHDWFVANGGRPNLLNRPKLVFPIQVINQAGEVITVDSPQAMLDLIALCRPVLGGGGHHGGGGSDTLNGGHHGGGDPDSLGGGHHGGGGQDSLGGHHGGPCFTLVFPLNISFSDSTQVTVNSPQELEMAAFTWNMNHHGHHARPELVFPITVTLRDGTQVVVNSKEELKAIQDACRG